MAAATTTAGAIPELKEAVETQTHELRRLAPLARLGDPESVHDMRVAARRLRSMLRATRTMLDPRRVQALRGELKWVGGLLGAVWELDVLQGTLTADASSLSGGDAVVATSLLQPLVADRAAAQTRLVEGLESTRFERLLEDLEAASTEPPWNGRTQRVGGVAANEFRPLRKRARFKPDSSNAALHEGRIRVKRARYAAELPPTPVARRPRSSSRVRRICRIFSASTTTRSSPGAACATYPTPRSARIRHWLQAA